MNVPHADADRIYRLDELPSWGSQALGNLHDQDSGRLPSAPTRNFKSEIVVLELYDLQYLRKKAPKFVERIRESNFGRSLALVPVFLTFELTKPIAHHARQV